MRVGGGPRLSRLSWFSLSELGRTVYFRVSRLGVGKFALETMVEGGPWNVPVLLPKTKQGEAMEGLRVFVYLHNDKAILTDLRVGRSVDVEGERAAASLRPPPAFSPSDAPHSCLFLFRSLSVCFV